MRCGHGDRRNFHLEVEAGQARLSCAGVHDPGPEGGFFIPLTNPDPTRFDAAFESGHGSDAVTGQGPFHSPWFPVADLPDRPRVLVRHGRDVFQIWHEAGVHREPYPSPAGKR